MVKNNEDKIEVPDIRRAPVVLPVQCGQCLFHKRMATYAKPCLQLGTPASAETCARFVPDPVLLGPDSGRALRFLASVRGPVLIAAAMLQARKIERRGFSLGEHVYTKVMGDDYLNNYASGYVVGTARDHVVVAGGAGYSALLLPSSLLNRVGWLAKAKSLIDRDRINDPKGGLLRITVRGKQRLSAFEPEPLGGKKARAKKRRDRQQRDGTATTTVLGVGRRRGGGERD